MSAYAGSLHTICRVVFWVFRFDQILVIALYFALHFDQIPSCTQYRRNLFYFQASNEFQPFFNTDQLSCRPSAADRRTPQGREMLNHVADFVHGERFLVQLLARAVRGNGNAGARVAVNYFRIHGVRECLG